MVSEIQIVCYIDGVFLWSSGSWLCVYVGIYKNLRWEMFGNSVIYCDTKNMKYVRLLCVKVYANSFVRSEFYFGSFA